MLKLALSDAREHYRNYLVYFLGPPYMTAEFHSLRREENGTQVRLVSLRPRSARNLADAWEGKALAELENGSKESSAFEFQAMSRLRYLGPAVTSPQCQSCHPAGERPNSVRGGISVSVPLQRYVAFARAHTWSLLPKFAALWALGLAGVGFATRNLGKWMVHEKQAQDALRESETRLSKVVAAGLSG